MIAYELFELFLEAKVIQSLDERFKSWRHRPYYYEVGEESGFVYQPCVLLCVEVQL